MSMAGLLAVAGIFIVILGVVSIALYVIFAYALYRMATNAILENSWMAWIPILQWYILGKLVGALKISTYEVPKIEVVLPVTMLATIVLKGIPVIGTVLSLANFILFMFALNKIYKMYKPEQAVLFTVLSIFGLPIPFIFMSIKDLIPQE